MKLGGVYWNHSVCASALLLFCQSVCPGFVQMILSESFVIGMLCSSQIYWKCSDIELMFVQMMIYLLNS